MLRLLRHEKAARAKFNAFAAAFADIVIQCEIGTRLYPSGALIPAAIAVHETTLATET